MEFFFGIIVTLFSAMMFLCGQFSANSEIATECQRQGSFYVGNKTFECSLKEVVR